MTDREQYTPGPASGAQVRKDGEKWTLILVRQLRHSPEKSGRRSPTRRSCPSGRPSTPIGACPEAMKFGWQRLNAEYAKQFGVATPNWSPNAQKR